MTKGIWETIIDEMGHHKLSDAQRAELASFHSHQSKSNPDAKQEDLEGMQMPWTQRSLPGIRTHH